MICTPIHVLKNCSESDFKIVMTHCIRWVPLSIVLRDCNGTLHMIGTPIDALKIVQHQTSRFLCITSKTNWRVCNVGRCCIIINWSGPWYYFPISLQSDVKIARCMTGAAEGFTSWQGQAKQGLSLYLPFVEEHKGPFFNGVIVAALQSSMVSCLDIWNTENDWVIGRRQINTVLGGQLVFPLKKHKHYCNVIGVMIVCCNR